MQQPNKNIFILFTYMYMYMYKSTQVDKLYIYKTTKQKLFAVLSIFSSPKKPHYYTEYG